jgi:hypothetical protein
VLASASEAIQRSGNTTKMAQHQHDRKCQPSAPGLQGPPLQPKTLGNHQEITLTFWSALLTMRLHRNMRV